MEPQKSMIDALLDSNHHEIGTVTDESAKHELQIIYTQIDRDSVNQPQLTTYEYAALPDQYFYPASSVKLYAAILALEKLNELAIDGLDRFTPLTIDSVSAGQTAVTGDSTSPDGRASIGHYIKKLFLVSDNDAFNRLYEFLGQAELNHRLWSRGLTGTRIFHRLSLDLTAEQNRHTNPFSFRVGDRIIFRQEAKYNSEPLANEVTGLRKGRGYMEDGQLVETPKDFCQKNFSPLRELHSALQRIVFPDCFPKPERFNLTSADYDFILKTMSMLPGESAYPSYPDSAHYYDSYVKFFLFGDSKKPVPKSIRIFNKVGDAYGYLIDNAYIVDFKNDVEFFLSAVVYVNENQIFNDDHYEYDTIGFPYLAKLGKIFYNHELERQRRYKPDLSRFVFDYATTD